MNEKQDEDEQLLTRFDLAKMLQITVFTLDLWRRNKTIDIKEIRFNKKTVRFRKKDAVLFLQKINEEKNNEEL